MSDSSPPAADGKQYHCIVCGDHFKRHEHLIRHSRRHTQEKPFKCDGLQPLKWMSLNNTLVCQKEFARRDILSRHAIVHVPAAERATMPQKTQKRGTKRVQQACNNCARGKCRCDGETPCSTCQARGLECEYTMSAPTKRKRADSSASTAAANVLLQVASSANASPKGEWSMDYNGSNHNDVQVAMQPPQPLIFGYQPSMITSMGHDPFPYQFNGTPRPISQFPSSVTSPANDISGPYESVPHDSSPFSFLFADTSKINLPGISSILPRLSSVHGFPDLAVPFSSSHHPDQASVYSNYRNDTTGTPSNMTRTGSPALTMADSDIPKFVDTMEESSSAPRMTETDRSHLQKYTQTQLPTTRQLNLLIMLYFEKYHHTLPIIHRPSYSVAQSAEILTLAIMTVGAFFWSQSSMELHQALVVLTHRILKMEPDSFASLQANLLLDVVELYSAQSQAQMEMVEDRRTLLIDKARSMHLFDEQYGDTPSEEASDEVRWQVLCRGEERRRFAWALFLFDELYFLMFDIEPLMHSDQMRISLPSHESLWEASNAQAWTALFAPDRLPLRSRSLWSFGKLEDRGAEEIRDCGLWCCTVLSFVEARKMRLKGIEISRLEVDQSIAPLQDVIKVDAQRSVPDHDSPSNVIDLLMDVSWSESRHSSISRLQAFQNIQFASLSTVIDLSTLRNFLMGDDSSIKGFLNTQQMRARRAALTASRILSHTSAHEQLSAWSSMVDFYAMLTLICFTKYHHGSDAFAGLLELGLTPLDSEEAKDWILFGSYDPPKRADGLSIQATISRVLERCLEISDNLLWARTTIKGRLQLLVEELA